MKTILAILFAGGVLALAQSASDSNSAPAGVPSVVPSRGNLSEAQRNSLLERARRLAAERSNAANRATSSAATSSAAGAPGAGAPARPRGLPGAAPGLPVPGARPAAGAPGTPAPGGPALAAPGAVVPGNAPGPGALAPAGGAPNVPAPAGEAAEEETAEYSYSYPAVDLEILLDDYAKLVDRTVLRPASLPANTKMTLVTQSPLTRTEAIQAFEAIFAMNGIATIPWGDKFVKVVQAAETPQAAAPFRIMDSTNAVEGAAYLSTNITDSAEYVCQIVQLRYAKPSEMIDVLAPYARIPNSIQAIDSSGILVIRDYAENVKRMLEMIERVDVTAASGVIEPVIIPIKYALAEDIANVLGSLTSGGSSTTVGQSSVSSRRGANRRGGLSRTSGQNPAVANQAGRAGVPTPAAGSSFAQRLQNIVNRASGGDFEVLGEVQIIADARTNSILVFAGRDDMEMITNIIDKLDVVLAQVLIQAIVLEVSLNDSQDYGVSLSQKPQSFGDKLAAGGVINNGQDFFDTLTTNFPGAAPEGFTYFGRIGDNWDATVQAIAKDSSINVLSRPSIQTSHAKPATFFVGDTVPYVTGTYYGYSVGGQSSSQYTQRDIGIEIDVTPLINPEGLVIMDIEQLNIEQLGTPTRIDGNDVPTTTKRYATANVAVKDGETIILGGFISNTRSKSKSGVPILKDIPLLGNLFSSHGEENKRVELVVLLRPTVLKTPEIAAKTAREEAAKLPGIRAAANEYERDYKEKLSKVGGKVPELFQDPNAVSESETPNPAKEDGYPEVPPASFPRADH